MSSIKTLYSAIERFGNSTAQDYLVLEDIARDILSDIESFYNEINIKYEEIRYEAKRALMMMEDVSAKRQKYEAERDYYGEEIEKLEQYIRDLYNNPSIEETYTDEEGNEYTEEKVDMEAVNEAEQLLQKAKEYYAYYDSKVQEANEIYNDAAELASDLDGAANEAYRIRESINTNITYINRYIDGLLEEFGYNLSSLVKVLNALELYLTSIKVFDGHHISYF